MLTAILFDEAQIAPSSKRLLSASTFFYTGMFIYVVSFFLPAVDPIVDIPGWASALSALAALGNHEFWSYLAFCGGLINPLVIVYIVLRIRDRAPRVRIGLASAILLFIPLTWLSLVSMKYRIEIGHVAWIAGLLLMISWTDFQRRSPAKI
jgi:hypothetical protein